MRLIDALLPSAILIEPVLAETFDEATGAVGRAIPYSTSIALVGTAYLFNVLLYALIGGLICVGINGGKRVLWATTTCIAVWWLAAFNGAGDPLRHWIGRLVLGS